MSFAIFITALAVLMEPVINAYENLVNTIGFDIFNEISNVFNYALEGFVYIISFLQNPFV